MYSQNAVVLHNTLCKVLRLGTSFVFVYPYVDLSSVLDQVNFLPCFVKYFLQNGNM